MRFAILSLPGYRYGSLYFVIYTSPCTAADVQLSFSSLSAASLALDA
jgi:hypothetical protein